MNDLDQFNQERLKLLREKYPDLLKNVSIDCGMGWYDILDTLLTTIVAVFNGHSRNIKCLHITQIKEKFGGLRFYYGVSGDLEDKTLDNIVAQIDGAIRLAEVLASRICEVCGEKGSHDTSGWSAVLCDKHKQDRHTL